MTRLFTNVGLTVALLIALGCAKADTAPGTGGAGAADEPAVQEGDVGDTDAGDSATAGDEPAAQGASIGEPAPAWEDLVGTDDQKHSLKDHAGADAVAVIFTCNHCPVAKAYEERLVALADDYKDKGFQLVAINVNNDEADRLPAMKERAEEKGFSFPYLYDPSQEIGRAFGAKVTPHAFLLDKERNIVYAGQIDDNMVESKVEEQHLREAIDAVLAGEQPKVATTKQFGCGINYE